MLEIPKGAVFGSSNPMMLGRAINGLQLFWSKDGESTYSHTGMFIDDKGTTLESLWTVRSQDFFSAYEGDNVIIAVPDAERFVVDSAVAQIVLRHKGQIYPAWRLLFHLFPPLAKVAPLDRLVCSELVAKYEWLVGVRHRQYKGTNPDTLADEWRRWKKFKVIFEGRLVKEDLVPST